MLCQFIAKAKPRLLTRDILNNRSTSIHLACRPLFCLRVAQLCITPLLICKNLCRSRGFRLFLIRGERGIRTPDTLLRYTHFPGALLKPLGHLSNISPRTKHLMAQKRAQDKNNFWFLRFFVRFYFPIVPSRHKLIFSAGWQYAWGYSRKPRCASVLPWQPRWSYPYH